MVEENPLHLGDREICFGDYQKLIGNKENSPIFSGEGDVFWLLPKNL